MPRLLTSSLNISKYINNQLEERRFFDTVAQRKCIQKEKEGKSLWKENFKRNKKCLVYALKYVITCETYKAAITRVK